MDFKIRKGVPVPKVTRGFAHSFPWDDMAAGDSFVVPASYWTEEREMNKADVTASKNMQRIRATFDKWKKADDKRASLNITFGPDHKTGDVQVWMVDKEQKAA